MKSNAHIKQYIDKITHWLKDNGFEPEVYRKIMRVIIDKSNGYTNPFLIFDRDSILVNVAHSKPISSRNREQLSKQLVQLNVEGVSYAYGLDKFDKGLMYADQLDISQTDAESDKRLDEFCQRAFITVPQILDDITASAVEFFALT